MKILNAIKKVNIFLFQLETRLKCVDMITKNPPFLNWHVHLTPVPLKPFDYLE